MAVHIQRSNEVANSLIHNIAGNVFRMVQNFVDGLKKDENLRKRSADVTVKKMAR